MPQGRQGIAEEHVVREPLEDHVNLGELGEVYVNVVPPVQGLQDGFNVPGPVEVVIGQDAAVPGQEPAAHAAVELRGVKSVLPGLPLEELPQEVRHLVGLGGAAVGQEGVSLHQGQKEGGGGGIVKDASGLLRGKGIQEGELFHKAPGLFVIGAVQVQLQQLVNAAV